MFYSKNDNFSDGCQIISNSNHNKLITLNHSLVTSRTAFRTRIKQDRNINPTSAFIYINQSHCGRFFFKKCFTPTAFDV